MVNLWLVDGQLMEMIKNSALVMVHDSRFPSSSGNSLSDFQASNGRCISSQPPIFDGKITGHLWFNELLLIFIDH